MEIKWFNPRLNHGGIDDTNSLSTHPIIQHVLNVNLIDNPLSIVITYTAYNLPITVMILLGFYTTIPREIEEAAIIDGSSVTKMFFRIILPISAPIMSTTVIINMIYNWNEFV